MSRVKEVINKINEGVKAGLIGEQTRDFLMTKVKFTSKEEFNKLVETVDALTVEE